MRLALRVLRLVTAVSMAGVLFTPADASAANLGNSGGKISESLGFVSHLGKSLCESIGNAVSGFPDRLDNRVIVAVGRFFPRHAGVRPVKALRNMA